MTVGQSDLIENTTRFHDVQHGVAVWLCRRDLLRDKSFTAWYSISKALNLPPPQPLITSRTILTIMAMA